MNEILRRVGRDSVSGRFTQVDEESDPEAVTKTGFETRFTPGNQYARTHGVRAFQLRGQDSLPAEIRDALDTFRAGIEADQGGAHELTTIRAGYLRRLTELEGCLLLLTADLANRGLITRGGRVRKTFTLLLQTIDRWDRVAQRLGLERRVREVPSLTEYLSARPSQEKKSHDAEPYQAD